MRRKLTTVNDHPNVIQMARCFKPYIDRMAVDPNDRLHPVVQQMTHKYPIAIEIVDTWSDDGEACFAVTVQMNDDPTIYTMSFWDAAVHFKQFMLTLNNQQNSTYFAELAIDLPLNALVDPYIRVAV